MQQYHHELLYIFRYQTPPMLLKLLPCLEPTPPLWSTNKRFLWGLVCTDMWMHMLHHPSAVCMTQSLVPSILRLRTFVFIITALSLRSLRSLSALHFKSVWSTVHGGPPCYWTIKRIEVNKVNGRHYFRSIVKQVAQDLFGQIRWFNSTTSTCRAASHNVLSASLS